MKSILIIGMGKFGHHLCADLIKNGNDIMVMDKDEAKVRDTCNWACSISARRAELCERAEASSTKTDDTPALPKAAAPSGGLRNPSAQADPAATANTPTALIDSFMLMVSPPRTCAGLVHKRPVFGRGQGNSIGRAMRRGRPPHPPFFGPILRVRQAAPFRISGTY